MLKFLNKFLKQKPKAGDLPILTLFRDEPYHNCTIGTLEDKNIKLYTLELPWKNNQSFISCIPAGIYKCVHYNGSKQSTRECWEILGVYGRKDVLIHIGNTTDDIRGCILVGLSKGILKGKRAVLSSGAALAELKNYIGRDEQGKLKSFWLEIKS